MKSTFLLLIVLFISGCASHKSVPTLSSNGGESYIQGNLHDELKAELGDFPLSNSTAQSSDEAELRRLQKVRTKEDCARAASEVIITLQSFYGKPYGTLTEAQVEILNPLFEKLHDDGGVYIGQIKKDYNRKRPYDYVVGLTPCVRKETSLAYPSGHATLSLFYALVLTDLFPDNAAAFEKRAEEISRDRLLAGVHHPTDIEAGRKLARLLYEKLRVSPLYQQDLMKYRTKLSAVMK